MNARLCFIVGHAQKILLSVVTVRKKVDYARVCVCLYISLVCGTLR